jgi:hypothetical protein
VHSNALEDCAVNPLKPEAYAPYREPRDYILSWTDVMWIDRAIGRLADHYDTRLDVHTAYGETYDFDSVIANSVQKFAAFPDGGTAWCRTARSPPSGWCATSSPCWKPSASTRTALPPTSRSAVR